MTTVADIRAIVEEAYPPHLAESWDKVGLICGDPADQVHKVAFALDCTQEVAERAVEAGAQMLVVHHPLLLFGTHTVATGHSEGEDYPYADSSWGGVDGSAYERGFGPPGGE